MILLEGSIKRQEQEVSPPISTLPEEIFFSDQYGVEALCLSDDGRSVFKITATFEKGTGQIVEMPSRERHLEFASDMADLREKYGF